MGTAFQKFMSGQKPIEAVIPNLQALVQNPRDILNRDRIVLAPLRMIPASGLIGTGIAAVGLFIVLVTKNYANFVAFFTYGLIVALIYGGFNILRNRSTRLVLALEGVEFHDGKRSAWCPWQLFNTVGIPILDSMQLHVSLPINLTALPLVELRRDGVCVAHGGHATFASFKLYPDAGHVDIRFMPEAPLIEVAQLLLALGAVLGTGEIREQPADSGFIASEQTNPSAAKLEGEWVHVAVTRLRLPPICCICGRATDAQLTIVAENRGGWLLLALTLGQVHPGGVTVSVPFCTECQSAHARRRGSAILRGGLIGAVISPILGLSLPVAFPQAFPPEKWRAFVIVEGFIMLFGGFIGSGLGAWFIGSIESAVSGASYSPSRQTVSLRFRRPGYAKEVCRFVNHLEQIS